jgi:hypothetical protein
LVNAVLTDDISRRHLKRQQEWQPYMQAWRGQHGDGEWLWPVLIKEVEEEHSSKPHLFAIESQGSLQALMIAQARYESNLGERKPLLYINYLAAAPWNRPGFSRVQNPTAPETLAKVGTAMILRAVVLSHQLGLAGRVGLHPLPPAVAFYLQGCHFAFIGKAAIVIDGEYLWCELPEVSSDFLLDRQGVIRP